MFFFLLGEIQCHMHVSQAVCGEQLKFNSESLPTPYHDGLEIIT